jgi:hypothetical protein
MIVFPHISEVRSAGFRSHTIRPQSEPLQSNTWMATRSLTIQAPSGLVLWALAGQQPTQAAPTSSKNTKLPERIAFPLQ